MFIDDWGAARKGEFGRIMRGRKNRRANHAGGVTRPEHGEQTLHVGVVYAVNEVRYVTAAASRAALALRLAEYVRRHASHQLWPGDERRLRRLLAARCFEAAVEHYFTAVGGRWDEERLVIETVDLTQSPGTNASPGAASIDPPSHGRSAPGVEAETEASLTRRFLARFRLTRGRSNSGLSQQSAPARLHPGSGKAARGASAQ